MRHLLTILVVLAAFGVAATSHAEPTAPSLAVTEALAQCFDARVLEQLEFDAEASDSVLTVYQNQPSYLLGASHVVIVAGEGVGYPYYCWDCLKYFREEEPPVSAAAAVEAAKGHHLELGLRPWRITYAHDLWYTDKSFWSVQSLIGRTDHGAYGDVVNIDAKTGKTIEVLSWISQ